MTAPVLPSWQPGATLFATQLLQLNTAITTAQATADAALAASGVTAGRNSIGLASAVPQALSYVAFGDSITAGYAASTAETTYVGVVASKLGLVPTNYGVSGSQAADQAPLIYPNFTPLTTGSQLVSLMIGTNDNWIYNYNTWKQAAFKSLHMALVAYLATPRKRKGQSTSITYVGAWTNSTKYGGAISKQTGANGATATFTLNGGTGYIAYTMEDANPATFSVAVDGLTIGSYTVAAEGGVSILTNLGATYGSACIRLANFSDEPHTVVITKTNGTGTFTLDWVASASIQASPDGVSVVVGGIPRGGDPSPPLVVFTNAIRQNCTLLARDGLAVTYADTPNAITEFTTDLIADKTHPNDAGMARLATAFMAAVGSQARAGGFKVDSNTKLPDILGENIVRGSNVTVTPQAYAGVVGGGDGHTLNLSYNVILGGRFNSTDGYWNVVGGFSCYTGGTYSLALGGQATDRAGVGTQAYASGAFAVMGDAQTTLRQLRIFTNNATPTRITSDGAAAYINNTVNLPDFASFNVYGMVTARQIGATGDTATWYFMLAVKRGSGAATLVFLNGKRETATAQAAIVAGTAFAPTFNDTGAAAWRVTLNVDTTNGGVSLLGTGEVAKNIIWTATLRTSELVG